METVQISNQKLMYESILYKPSFAGFNKSWLFRSSEKTALQTWLVGDYKMAIVYMPELDFWI